jgi:hypothetical protein
VHVILHNSVAAQFAKSTFFADVAQQQVNTHAIRSTRLQLGGMRTGCFLTKAFFTRFPGKIRVIFLNSRSSGSCLKIRFA